MLERSLRELPGTEVLNFSWRAALLEKYDVFHVHWPEILANGASPFKKFVRQTLTAALLIRLQTRHIPIVRTVHNVRPPEGVSLREKLLLRWVEHNTALRITLNPDTEVGQGVPHVVIPHGDYRAWFSKYPASPVVEGQLAFAGLMRRYKGVEGLLLAFQATENMMDGLTLRLAGKPSTPELAREILRLAAPDQRIRIDLRFISDAELVDVVTSSELVVLPYRFMHNSGALLTALSLNRPVLAPRNAVNERISQEVGPGWVHMYEGDLSQDVIIESLQSVRTQARPVSPEFVSRSWPETAARHATAYQRALSLSRRHKSAGTTQ
ncbi:glycosyltransferase [Arthrobacter rhizosphaerae]|uniref:glycosyltransferase n=1 Tax=Arthrobacter rhizosphaerae TaxID=2855490 RepID=UPI001FF52EB0|nr:glycosyl transferase [Arthrobacter rhizosphaerae]